MWSLWRTFLLDSSGENALLKASNSPGGLSLLPDAFTGKFILPYFGGTPAVWSTLMLLFQALLTGGYAYAYWLIARVRRQSFVHILLLALAAILLAWRSALAAENQNPLPHTAAMSTRKRAAVMPNPRKNQRSIGRRAVAGGGLRFRR